MNVIVPLVIGMLVAGIVAVVYAPSPGRRSRRRAAPEDALQYRQRGLVCLRCGLVVGDAGLHGRWHDQLERAVMRPGRLRVLSDVDRDRELGEQIADIVSRVSPPTR